MPTWHDFLTPNEHEAALLLARLCSIPTNDVAMASIVLLREVAHSVAPGLQRPPLEILDHLRTWPAGRAGASG